MCNTIELGFGLFLHCSISLLICTSVRGRFLILQADRLKWRECVKLSFKGKFLIPKQIKYLFWLYRSRIRFIESLHTINCDETICSFSGSLDYEVIVLKIDISISDKRYKLITNDAAIFLHLFLNYNGISIFMQCNATEISNAQWLIIDWNVPEDF